MTKDEIKDAVAEVLGEFFVAGKQDGLQVATARSAGTRAQPGCAEPDPRRERHPRGRCSPTSRPP
jgi:hypothetical protein